ncbi:MAG: histidinol-phosphatase [Prevotella sp.]|nr:histidinol-phosphatase [Bacteroides sp.]MCM1366101.1 histidinol-phosphatase [Prevotella sp.]MCM1436586.1 histidinol-phosphatase [Prevotella sp.]
MTADDIKYITEVTQWYNFHSHTQFCDGRASMSEMAQSAVDCGMLHYGFSPHSPIAVESKCNMKREEVQKYLDEVEKLREYHTFRGDKIYFYAGMEIDRLNHDHSPHIDYYQNLPLDYRIGSVHFVETREGEFVDCDGSAQRFIENLETRFRGDLRYVVEKFYESELLMIEEGGFDILGHCDKIAANMSAVNPAMEKSSWYEALIEDLVSHIKDSGVIVEINTKSFEDRRRFFPEQNWWKKFADAGIPLMVNSDAHYPDKINYGRKEALAILDNLRGRLKTK